jgi:hypothetical protein
VISADSRKRIVLLAIGLLVLLAPVLILVFTLGTLAFFGDLVLGRVTFVELFELYLIELVVFLGLAYSVYRLTLWAVQESLPTTLDALEEDGDGTDDRIESDPDDT